MADGHKANGQFAPGWKGGPGRPKRAIEEQYLKWLRARVSHGDWIKIIDVAMARAKAGDHQARQFLAEYLMGKAVQRQEHTGTDGGHIVFEVVRKGQDE